MSLGVFETVCVVHIKNSVVYEVFAFHGQDSNAKAEAKFVEVVKGYIFGINDEEIQDILDDCGYTKYGTNNSICITHIFSEKVE